MRATEAQIRNMQQTITSLESQKHQLESQRGGLSSELESRRARSNEVKQAAFVCASAEAIS